MSELVYGVNAKTLRQPAEGLNIYSVEINICSALV